MVEEKSEHQPVFAAFGNPLLDIIVPDEDGALVESFSLQADIAQEVDTLDIGLLDASKTVSGVEYSGGGCALNTVRVYQWLSGVEHDSMFLGGLGRDHSGSMLQSLIEKDGVKTNMTLHQDLPTGHCIALVRGSERTLCANLGAANKYDISDLWNSDRDNVLQNTKVIYVEGYFLTHRFETSMELALFAQKHKITFVFNLCGEYVCEDIKYVENVLKLLPFVDILFGNRSEFEVFINTVEAKLETSSSVIKNLRAMITGLLQQSFKEFKINFSVVGEGVENLDMKIENICESPVRRKPKSLIVVVTEGCQPVQCYSIGDTLKTISVPVPNLEKSSIKVSILSNHSNNVDVHRLYGLLAEL